MKKVLILFFLGAFCINSSAQITVSTTNNGTAFPIVSAAGATTVLYDKEDDSLVHIAARLFSDDTERVTGKRPKVVNNTPKENNLILIGTLEKSSYLQGLVKKELIDVTIFKDKWDGYHIQVVNKPFKGVDRALVIAGSNKRGAAYGTLELSAQMGVSPWYWWADVPVAKKNEVYVPGNINVTDAPKVKYRGIFINDEAPAFSGWAIEKFGGFNHHVYEKVFELLLRLKGNYMWPAMWGRAFNDDDKLNPVLADKWGIVMGTSHHEPMQRAQQEWKRYGNGAWDYTKNEAVLKDFWKKGIENMGNHESLVTIGMRGDGDEPMTEGTATALLEKIVKDQRNIIEEVTKKPADQTPQVWALYKEVQDYYDKGMRVPDDVTLLLCDDNWGNIRKLPKKGETARKGGYGIYYHFDYVGDPRNYKWINTNNIARVWEQMHLAWEYDVKQIWVVNVGDIKPMEFPTSFFLDYAWDPEKWDTDNLRDYYNDWAAKQFGTEQAKEIGYVLRKYGQIAARRKPELTDAKTYSVDNYDEAFTVVGEYKALLKKAKDIQAKLPAACHDAFYQLVLHPVEANGTLHQMYLAVALNRKYAAANDARANEYADLAKQLFRKDAEISHYYNKELADGKWNHFMDQVHIGYTSWNDPKNDIMPEVVYVKEASKAQPVLESKLVKKTAKAEAIMNEGLAFYEQDGYISIEAEHYSKAVNTNRITWKVIPDIGRTGSGVSAYPVTASIQQPGGNNPHLEYDFYSYDAGKVNIETLFSPTLNFHNTEKGLRYAVSIDNGAPQIVSINNDTDIRVWRQWVSDNVIAKTTEHTIAKPGKHTLKVWMVDPGVVLQKIVIDFGGAKESYLGAPETRTGKQY